MEQFLFAEGAAALTALINNDRTYLDSRAQKLSPLAQEALDTARTAITEIGIYLIDHTNAETFGKIVGQVIYEVLEDAVSDGGDWGVGSRHGRGGHTRGGRPSGREGRQTSADRPPAGKASRLQRTPRR
jgi:hypothetical protein